MHNHASLITNHHAGIDLGSGEWSLINALLPAVMAQVNVARRD